MDVWCGWQKEDEEKILEIVLDFLKAKGENIAGNKYDYLIKGLETIELFPNCGAAVLLVPLYNDWTVYVVGLDRWKFEIANEETRPKAAPFPVILPIGRISDKDAFFKIIRGDNRKSLTGTSPEVVYKFCQEIVGKQDEAPLHGFPTLATGYASRSRMTWELLKALIYILIQWHLEYLPDREFHELMVQLDQTALHHELQQPNANLELIEEIMASYSKYLGELALQDYEVQALIVKAKEARDEVQRRFLQRHHSYILPSLVDFELTAIDLQSPQLSVSDVAEVASSGTSLESFRSLAKRSLGVPLLLPIESSPSDILEALKPSTSVSETHKIVQLESCVFLWISKLLSDDPIFDEEEAENLLKITEEYRKLMKWEVAQAWPVNSIKSRVVLLQWAVTCIIHHILRTQLPLAKNYGIALRYEDLDVLVLPNAEWWKAMETIIKYIHKTSQDRSKVLFSLRNEEMEGTRSFAYEYGVENEDIQELLSEYRLRDDDVQHEKWRSILSMKQRREALKDNLKDIEAKISALPFFISTDMAKEERNSLLQQKKEKMQELKNIETFQPARLCLPEDDEEAYLAIMFLHLPPLWRSLAKATFVSYMLMCFGDKLPPISGSKSYCDAIRQALGGQKDMQDLLPTQTEFFVSYKHDNPNNNVDAATEDDAAVHPIEVDVPFYMVNQSVYNPFLVAKADFVEYFAANFEDEFVNFSQLPLSKKPSQQSVSGSVSLDWMLRQPGRESVNADRSNLGMANLHQSNIFGSQATKTGFLTLSNLRSYPRRQLRALCVALRDIREKKIAPLSHRNTHSIINQVIYHVGPTSNPDEASFKWDWKYDLFTDEFVATIRTEMEAWIEYLTSAIRDYLDMEIIAELVGLFSALEITGFRSTTKNARMVCKEWARACEMEYAALQEEGGPQMDKIITMLLVKAYIISQLPILTFSTSKLESSELMELLELIICVQKNRASLDFSKLSQLDANLNDTIKRLKIKVDEVVSYHINNLVANIDHQSVTTSVRLVLGEHLLPMNAEWNLLPDSYYLETVVGENLISVDCKHGHILYNGFPPSQLPQVILTDDLYKRSFHGCEMVVVRQPGDKLVTKNPIQGRVYEFQVRSKDVYMWEVDEFGTRWGLLSPKICDGTSPALRDLFSHWYDGKTVLFRGIRFDDRKISHIAVKKFIWYIYQVPSFEHNLETMVNNMTSYDLWIRPQSDALKQVIQVLAKFEKKEYIQTFAIHEEGQIILKIRFDRFGLDFILREGRLASSDYHGFELATQQRLDGMLIGFHHYLVLEAVDPESIEMIENGEKRIIIPHLQLALPSKKFPERMQPPRLELPQGSDLKFSCNTFKLDNRTGFLKANSIAARLQLASIFSHVSTMVNEPALHMTASQFAMRLLRQCWVNRPFDKVEREHLIRVCCKNEPALALLVDGLLNLGQQYSFLYPAPGTKLQLERSFLQMTEYMTTEKFSPRSCLSKREEELVGVRRINFSKGSSPDVEFLTGLVKNVEVDVDKLRSYNSHISNLCRINASTHESICEYEQTLLRTIQQIPNTDSAPFPISLGEKQSYISQHLQEQLQISWESHLSLPSKKVKLDNLEFLQEQKLVVSKERESVYQNILKVLATLPDTSSEVLVYQAHQIRGWIPEICFEDLLVAYMNPATLRNFNPFLNSQNLARIADKIESLLLLCVLEDRLHRICTYLSHGAHDLALRDLEVHRMYNPKVHKEWLVFEVEQRIQLRPNQISIINDVLEKENGTFQLNMGLGKTRVIVPALALFLSRESRDVESPLLRIVVPQSLMDETYQYLHSVLSASSLRQKLYKIPFTRQVLLNKWSRNTLSQTMDRIKHDGGMLLMTPEHIQSLHLRAWEESVEDNTDLKRKVIDRKWFTLIDETDEVLSSKRQLIYARGEQQPLPQGHRRWCTIQAVLFVLGFDKEVKSILETKGLSSFTPGKGGEWSNLVFLPGKQLETSRERLQKAILATLIKNPHYPLEWLHNAKEYREDIESFCLKSEIPTQVFQRLHTKYVGDKWFDLLVLRGLFAHDLLVHCLQRRNRVDFGVWDKDSKDGRKVAIPFKAANIPSLRTEFAQPDVSLLHTMVAWYCDGLSQSHLIAAIKELTTNSNPNMQQEEYSRWLQGIEISPEERVLIDSPDKLDVSNLIQLKILMKVYSKSVRVINFWLNQCILPSATVVYPSKLLASPWHITDGQRASGFSGTNDSDLLLPLHIKGITSSDKFILATNGKMMSLFCNKGNYRVQSGDCETIIAFAVQNYDALIDVGAITAGWSNEQVAEAILDVDSKFKGVAYFDGKRAGWVVRTKKGRWKLENSPIPASELFVFFDEGRCRGADIKMAAKAKAMVTLCPKLCKDTLTQAIGRLRQLEFGQSFVMVASEELDTLIKDVVEVEDNVVKVPDVLKWVIFNTEEMITKGLSQWTYHGVHYGVTKTLQEKMVLPEAVDVIGYAEPVQTRTVKEALANFYQAISGQEYSPGLNGFSDLDATVTTMSDQKVTEHRHQEETERELEVQANFQEEAQRQTALVEPISETETKYWDLANFVSSYVKKMQSLDWKDCGLVLTNNFGLTVTKSSKNIFQDQYLRLVDAIQLRNVSGTLVLTLLSEREFDDAILNSRSSQDVKLVQFSHVQMALKKQLEKIPMSDIYTKDIDRAAFTCLELFAGCTNFSCPEYEDYLLEKVVTKANVVDATGICDIRGNGIFLEGSDLEKLVEVVNGDLMSRRDGLEVDKTFEELQKLRI